MIIVKKKLTKDKHGYSAMKLQKSSGPGYSSSSSSYESVKSFSTNDYINSCLEKAFSDGYEYAQREFAKVVEAENAVTTEPGSKPKKDGFKIKLSDQAKKTLKYGALSVLAASALAGSVIGGKKLIKDYKEKKKKEETINKEKARFI